VTVVLSEGERATFHINDIVRLEPAKEREPEEELRFEE